MQFLKITLASWKQIEIIQSRLPENTGTTNGWL